MSNTITRAELNAYFDRIIDFNELFLEKRLPNGKKWLPKKARREYKAEITLLKAIKENIERNL